MMPLLWHPHLSSLDTLAGIWQTWQNVLLWDSLRPYIRSVFYSKGEGEPARNEPEGVCRFQQGDYIALLCPFPEPGLRRDDTHVLHRLAVGAAKR